MADNKKMSEDRHIFLVQHGEAVGKEENPDRPLTEAGRAIVEQVADWAARVGLPVGQIRHSGKLRAQQTATILAEKLQPKDGVAIDDRMAPKADVTPVAEALQDCPCSVILVAHMPFLSRLAGLLVAGDSSREVIQFHQGGVVGLTQDDNGWRVWCAVPPELI
jgi:phosphohistidine phosphatase